jgi:hypothetical protein
MNYSELVAVSIAYADRYDLEVEQNMDNYIIMVEARINRLLKTRKQSARVYTATIADQDYYSLPPDYAGMRDVQLNSDSPLTSHSVSPVSYLSPEIFNRRQNEPYGGCVYYTVLADQIQIFPKPTEDGQTIEMVYYQKLPPLTALNTTNWLSEDYPDIYLAGITAEIELFAKNYETADGWFERMKISVNELDNTDIVERWSGTALVTRIDRG